MSLHILITIGLIATAACNGWLFWFLSRQASVGVSRTLLVLHLFSTLCWTLSVLLLLFIPDSILVGGTTFVSALLLALTKYYFVITFPEDEMPYRLRYHLVLLPVAFFMVVAFIPGALYTNMQSVEGYYLLLDNGPLAGWYALFVTYLLLHPIFHLCHKMRRVENGKTKLQLRFLTYGISGFFVIGLITNSILPVFFEIYVFNSLGPMWSVFLAGFIVYIISRHEFLDIKLVIQRGLVYFAVFFAIVTMYAGMLGITSVLFTDETSRLQQYTASILAIILSVATVPQLDRYLRRVTDRWLFVDRYHYQTALSELSSILQSSLHMDTLLDACTGKLQEILRTRSIIITPEKTATASADKLTIPIKLQDKLVGIISLGEKKSGLAYTKEDKDLLETFATQAATAISRVFLYQEIKQKAEELEQKVAERTAELAEAYDDQTQLMLHISHNLQTPLAILRTKIDSLDSSMVNTDAFTQTLDQVSVFIQQLLRLARLEHTDDTVELVDIDMSALLQEITDEANVIADMSEVAITHSIAADLRCTTNEQQVREIVMNLLSNAIKYIGDAEPKKITVTATQDAGTITIAVTDTGIGIAPDSLTSVFERFHRNETTKAIAGTGLGLAITKQLVEQIGGTIKVESVLDQGSTFTVVLPR